MNKNARLFLSYGAAVDGRHAHRRFLQYRGYHFYRLEQRTRACFGGRYLALVMMFGAVGDMLGTGAAIIIASREVVATCGWHGSAWQHAGLAGIV